MDVVNSMLVVDKLGMKLVSEQKEKCFGEESLGNDWLFTRLEEEEESKKVESDAKDLKFW